MSDVNCTKTSVETMALTNEVNMAGWHEDFEDAPECEEVYDDSDVLDECDCGECDECSERLWSEYEQDQDHMLAQQELEDFEGCGWNEEYNDAF